MAKILVLVTSDLSTDQRVHKVSTTFTKAGHDVTLIGRLKKNSKKVENRIYQTHRFSLFFEKGALFYVNFSITLFFKLLFTKFDILVSNDLDTLAPCWLVAKIKNKRVLFDSHEYFTGVPELTNRPFIRSIWKAIEKFIFPRLKYVYTVNNSLALKFSEEYKIKVEIVRNFPFKSDIETTTGFDFGINKKIILYQGAVNVDRGLEEMIHAMKWLDDYYLYIIGDGDCKNELAELIFKLKLEHKVHLKGQVSFEELPKYTRNALFGISIEKPTNINYEFCLPNKVFDYIHAGIPILGSPLIEIEAILTKYDVGALLTSHEPAEIANFIKLYFTDENIQKWKTNTIKARNELCWENEESTLLKMIK